MTAPEELPGGLEGSKRHSFLPSLALHRADWQLEDCSQSSNTFTIWGHFPKFFHDASSHCWRNLQGLMDAHEIVVNEIDRNQISSWQHAIGRPKARLGLDFKMHHYQGVRGPSCPQLPASRNVGCESWK
jgi:hypothetical protein